MQTTQPQVANGTVVHEEIEGCPIRFRYPEEDERVYGPPTEGEEAWFDLGIKDVARVCRVYRNGGWIPVTKGGDDGP